MIEFKINRNPSYMQKNNYKMKVTHKLAPDQIVIDEEQFEDMCTLLEDDFAGLVQSFFVDSFERIKLMREAQASNNNTEGYEAAHALKGASATLGAKQLEILSGRLQDACRDHNIADQTALIDQISVALQKVEREISSRLGL